VDVSSYLCFALLPLFGVAFAVIAYDLIRSRPERKEDSGRRGFEVLPPRHQHRDGGR
jgi:hypothetical protein